MEITATLVKRNLPDFTGTAHLYELSEPVPAGYEPWDESERTMTTHVVVSAVVAYSGPETYIFAANADGRITDWGEMPGSYRGGLDHDRALFGAGWTVA